MAVEQQNNEQPKQSPYTGILVGMVLVILLNGLVFPNILRQQIIDTDYGTFISMVKEGKVKKVKVEDSRIYFSALNKDNTEGSYQTGVINDPELVDRLLAADSPNEEGKIIFTKKIPLS